MMYADAALTCKDDSTVALSWQMSIPNGGVCMMRRKRSNCPRSMLRLRAEGWVKVHAFEALLATGDQEGRV